MLQCPICSRNGFQRLTFHLSQSHGIKKAEALDRWPGIQLEVSRPDEQKPCSGCGAPVTASARAAYVKCDDCRQSDDREKVSCRVCGEERRNLTPHIKAHHQMTVAEYKAQFPGAEVFVPTKRSAEFREGQSARAKKRWSDPKEREAQSERLKESAAWLGKNLSKAHRAAISKGGTGVKHNMTPEGIKVIGDQGRRSLVEIRKRPGYRKKLSEGQRRRVARGEKVGFQIPGRWEKAMETRIRNGTHLFGVFGGKSPRGIGGFRKGLGHYTRSTLEANFARILLELGIKYRYEPQCFRLELQERRAYYTPDFHIESPVLLGEQVIIPAGWVELKGWREKTGAFPGNSEAKVEALRLQVTEPVTIIAGTDAEYRALCEEWRFKITLWERGGYNLRTHPEVFSGTKPMDNP